MFVFWCFRWWGMFCSRINGLVECWVKCTCTTVCVWFYWIAVGLIVCFVSLVYTLALWLSTRKSKEKLFPKIIFFSIIFWKKWSKYLILLNYNPEYIFQKMRLKIPIVRMTHMRDHFLCINRRVMTHAWRSYFFPGAVKVTILEKGILVQFSKKKTEIWIITLVFLN